MALSFVVVIIGGFGVVILGVVALFFVVRTTVGAIPVKQIGRASCRERV